MLAWPNYTTFSLSSDLAQAAVTAYATGNITLAALRAAGVQTGAGWDQGDEQPKGTLVPYVLEAAAADPGDPTASREYGFIAGADDDATPGVLVLRLQRVSPVVWTTGARMRVAATAEALRRLADSTSPEKWYQGLSVIPMSPGDWIDSDFGDTSSGRLDLSALPVGSVVRFSTGVYGYTDMEVAFMGVASIELYGAGTVINDGQSDPRIVVNRALLEITIKREQSSGARRAVVVVHPWLGVIAGVV